MQCDRLTHRLTHKLILLPQDAAMLAVLRIIILSVRPSVYVSLSVTRLLCDKTKQRAADISIPNEGQSL